MERQACKTEFFGSRIAECRRGKNLTQEEFSNQLGVTPQALSKWERGLSAPDLFMISDICNILDVSADYLIGTKTGKITEDGNIKVQEEIWSNLRNGLEPLQLIFGKDLLPFFMDSQFMERITKLRIQLSKEGILMPVVRVADQFSLRSAEFMVLSCQKVLYNEVLEKAEEDSLDYIIDKLGKAVRADYAEMINVDMVKSLTDNLKIKYPVLIESTVPEKISYTLLLDVVREFLRRGNTLIYLPKIIEIAEHELRENGSMHISELVERVAGQIDREDNFQAVMAKRAQASLVP